MTGTLNFVMLKGVLVYVHECGSSQGVKKPFVEFFSRRVQIFYKILEQGPSKVVRITLA